MLSYLVFVIKTQQPLPYGITLVLALILPINAQSPSTPVGT